MTEPTGLDEAAEAVRAHWSGQHKSGRLTLSSVAHYERELNTFVRFATASSVTDVSGVSARVCRSWVFAPVSAISPGSRGRAGQAASTATRRNRLVVLRQMLAVWAEAGWVEPGLLDGLVISKDPALPPCPVTPPEVVDLRRAGVHSRVDTLLPMLVELAVHGLNLAEIAALHVADFDAATGVVLVNSNANTPQRNVVLEPAARAKTVRHIQALDDLFAGSSEVFDPISVPLALHPTPRSVRDRVRPTVVGQHLYRALKLAGITRAGVTPGSMRQYAANACYAHTNRVEDVATTLGITSLDAAFRLIDQAWQNAWAQTVREQAA